MKTELKVKMDNLSSWNGERLSKPLRNTEIKRRNSNLTT